MRAILLAVLAVRLCSSSFCLDSLAARQPRQLPLHGTLRWRLSGVTPWLTSRDTVARNYRVPPSLYGRSDLYILTCYGVSPTGKAGAGGSRFYVVQGDSTK